MAQPILVVDDDRLLREGIAVALELEGYPVQTAGNGADALDCVLACRPALVILDIDMPMLDGRGFVARMQARGLHLPILIMSGTTRHPRAIAQALGAIGYLAKPFALAELLRLVQRQLRGPMGPTERSWQQAA